MQNRLLLYDTFNARYLSFQDVAQSFVPNEEFFKLTRDNSVLLMGPRGCGKTTLLKMLTPAGQHFWSSPESHDVKENINFTAVYIPSDIQWKNQFDYLNLHLNDKRYLIELITNFLFASNVQIALCKSFNSVIGFGELSEEEKVQLEFNICNSLMGVWGLMGDGLLPTFDGIELAILNRVRIVNELIKKMIFNQEFESINQLLPNYVFSDFFDLVQVGCKVFEQKLELKDSHKWALCFDELEIVPKFIQVKLMKFLRSVDQKFLFKLTTTPLFKIEDTILDSNENNDFNAVKLWVYDEQGLQRWRKFCENLLIHRFEKKYNINTEDLESFFGNYNLDEIVKDELNDLKIEEKKAIHYDSKFKPGLGKGSAMYFLYKRLAQIDPSFKIFLQKRKISPNEPYSEDKVIQKSVFLKYKVDTVFRLIYKNRTRKIPPIHYGLPYIFDLCDGNPRLLIGLIDEILQNSNSDFRNLGRSTKREQSKIIYNSSDKYFNLITNHPDSTIIVSNSEFNLATDLLDKIGKYMHNKIVQNEFSKTSPSTFVIDEDINAKFVKLLETALHLGAIVYLDPIESLSNTGIVGKRFRLSSYLTPKYKIPSRTLSQVKLSTILKLTTENHQQTFFD